MCINVCQPQITEVSRAASIRALIIILAVMIACMLFNSLTFASTHCLQYIIQYMY